MAVQPVEQDLEREPIEDGGSLSDHEAQFSVSRAPARPSADVDHEGTGAASANESHLRANADAALQETITPGRVDAPRKPAERRPQSHKATAGDVEDISRLTGEIRELEKQLGKTSKGDRVESLKRQLRGLKAELDEQTPRTARSEQAPARVDVPPARTEVQPTTFSEPEPSEKDFPIEKYAQLEDPYGAQQRAIARAQAGWDQRKLHAEQAQRAAEESRQRAVQDQAQAADRAFTEREQTFATRQPDYQQKIQTFLQSGQRLPSHVIEALKPLDNGPELLYKLLDRGDLINEFWLMNPPSNPYTFAALQRRLTTGLIGVSTGAPPAPSPAEKRLPKPPTPVRTGPMTMTESAPDDHSSLADHEAYFHKKTRR